MRLRPRHISLLTQLEKKVYASLIGPIDFDRERRDHFINLSHKYIEGDENVLPFPERSKRGIMLLTLCQQLAAPYTQASAVLAPAVPEHSKHIQQKLLASGASRVYAVPGIELTSALYGAGTQPFCYFREKPDFKLKNLPNDPNVRSNLLCALNPIPQSIKNTPEFNVLGVILKRPDDNSDLNQLPLFAESARLGLTDVTEIGSDRFWLTKDETEKP